MVTSRLPRLSAKDVALEAARLLKAQKHPLMGVYVQDCAGGQCYCIEGAIKAASGWYDHTYDRARENSMWKVIETFKDVMGETPIQHNDRTLRTRKTTQSHVRALLKVADAL